MRRLAGAAAAAVIGTSTLTGCGVPPGGIVGVAVDTQGKPLIVVQMWEGHIDGASMYLRDPRPEPETPQDKAMGRWEVTPAVAGFSQFTLTAGENGWRLIGTLERRDPATRYTIYGWTHDNSWSASHVEFAEQDLARLEPGTVWVGTDNERHIESLTDFRTKTCEH